ncbi:MAG: twin-arginine translocation signal domain-containing protein [Usitatibacter sp.]
MQRRVLLKGLGLAAGALGAGGMWPGPAVAQVAVPIPLRTNLVRASPTRWRDRDCLSVELTDDAQARVLAGRGGNGPSYVVVARDFADGTIEVDVGAELTGKGQRDARGFAGIAFHIDEDREEYEAVYLRMTNGRLNEPRPPAPLVERAIQYVAHPDFHFNVSRQKFPGRYERGADIALGRWHRLRLEIQGSRARALVDGREALAVDDLHYAGRRGAVGLWIDDGSRGFFSALDVTKAQG